MPHVLIVDDEPEIVELIVGALNERGLKVKAAHTDHDALDVLEREAAQLSVLVTDINLGKGVTGFDLARKARQLNPAVTVVYITGQMHTLDRFAVDGAVLVEKPFETEAFADQVAGLTVPPVQN
jgi:CheY-like chemotaxis protein